MDMAKTAHKAAKRHRQTYRQTESGYRPWLDPWRRDRVTWWTDDQQRSRQQHTDTWRLTSVALSANQQCINRQLCCSNTAFSAVMLLIGQQEGHLAGVVGCWRGYLSGAGTRKVIPIWISRKQEPVSGSGISWVICKSAPHSRQITTPAPHHSVFFHTPNALPAAQPTASKHWRHKHWRHIEQSKEYSSVSQSYSVGGSSNAAFCSLPLWTHLSLSSVQILAFFQYKSPYQTTRHY